MSASSANDKVLYEIDGPIARITINRPEKLNAIDAETVVALRQALQRAESDDSVKVLVFSGAGNRAFSSGYDINDEIEAPPTTAADWRAVLRDDNATTMAIWGASKPTIAEVNGWCLAGGCEIAMACDMIVATPKSKFGEPEIQYGSGPVTLLMPFLIGEKKTNELLLTGAKIDAEEALRIGLINRIVSEADIRRVVTELAMSIAPTPLEVLRLTKQALNRAYEAMGLRIAVESNVDISAILNAADTPEQNEFDAIAGESGLKAALAWRDQRYEQA